jgi:GAF domain-containing protein
MPRNGEDAARLLAELHTASSPYETVQATAEAARELVDCDAVGVMLVTDGQVESAGVTDEFVVEADRQQMILNEGPCLSALAEGEVFRIADTLADPRWPKWGPAIERELGIRSVLSVRLARHSQRVVGSLNFYAHRVDAFDLEDEAMGKNLALHAAIALGSARREARFQEAVDGRTRIGQAQGILMSMYQLNAEQAFAVLVRYSQQRNVKLRAVAEEVIERRGIPADES